MKTFLQNLQKRLAAVLSSTVELLGGITDGDTKAAIRDSVSQITSLAANWLESHMDRPRLENEKLIGEILLSFEEVKMKRLERQLKELEVIEKKLTMAISLMRLISQYEKESADDAPNFPDLSKLLDDDDLLGGAALPAA